MTFDLSKLRKLLDRPVWETCNFVRNGNTAGAQARYLKLPAYNLDFGIFAANATNAILEFNAEADASLLLPASGMSGTFGAGATCFLHPMGPAGTATAGSTVTVTTNLTITRQLTGFHIRITGGPGAGDIREILSNTIGANSVITVAAANPFSEAITNASTYQLVTGQLWLYNPHTAFPWSYFRSWDRATNSWSSNRAIPSGLAAAWATDAQLRGTPSCTGNRADSHLGKVFGSCTTGVLTLTSGAKWATNFYQGGVLTVIAGTGYGQVRTIASNTDLTVTFDTALTTPLDATSKYIIEKPYESSRGKTFASATTTVLTLSAGANWTLPWCNYQIRILSGTGAGQVRTISASTALTLTVSAAWTVTPDATSVWVIEANDDNLYLQGNNSVNVYRYSRVADTFTTLVPTAARSGAAGAGASLTWVSAVDDATWNNPDACKNGRYFYSFRGAGATTLDIFDIAGGTAGATTWTSNQLYGSSGDLVITGYSFEYDDKNNILMMTNDSRLLRFDILKNALFQVSVVDRIQGTATVGDKLFNVPFFSDGIRLDFIYHWRNSGQELSRLPLWSVYGG